MNIDWSKAPIDATHCIPETDRKHGIWLKAESGYWWEMAWPTRIWSCIGGPVIDLLNMVKRPDKPWTGEGLPPVRTVCEWFDADSGHWLKSEIAFLSSWVIVVRDVFPHPDGPVDIAFDLNKIHPKFRMIRTPEQIAADEIETILNWMVNRDSERGLRGIAEDLHADGYRKQVTE